MSDFSDLTDVIGSGNRDGGGGGGAAAALPFGSLSEWMELEDLLPPATASPSASAAELVLHHHHVPLSPAAKHHLNQGRAAAPESPLVMVPVDGEDGDGDGDGDGDDDNNNIDENGRDGEAQRPSRLPKAETRTPAMIAGETMTDRAATTATTTNSSTRKRPSLLSAKYGITDHIWRESGVLVKNEPLLSTLPREQHALSVEREAGEAAARTPPSMKRIEEELQKDVDGRSSKKPRLDGEGPLLSPVQEDALSPPSGYGGNDRDLIDGEDEDDIFGGALRAHPRHSIDADVTGIKLEPFELDCAMPIGISDEVYKTLDSPDYASEKKEPIQAVTPAASTASDTGRSLPGGRTPRSSADASRPLGSSPGTRPPAGPILVGKAQAGLTAGGGVSLAEKRRIETARFPTASLESLAGTTSAEVRRMSGEERELVLFKRKLRNRESARRSRQKRQATLAELQEEMDELAATTGRMVDMGLSLHEDNEALRKQLELTQAELRALRSVCALHVGGGSSSGELFAPEFLPGRPSTRPTVPPSEAAKLGG